MMHKPEELIVPALVVEQPIGTFYVCTISHEDLLFICSSDIRDYESTIQTDKRDIEIYSGIERELSKKRVKQIAQYITNVDATFPGSIIINLEIDRPNAFEDADNQSQDSGSKYVRYENGQLIISKRKDIGTILDGQHRLFGLAEGKKLLTELKRQSPRFDLVVSIFVDLDLEDQAIVFSTINKEHTKVNKSVVFDLFDYAKNRSPQRSAHLITRACNELHESPFKDRIKVLGRADDPSKELITQATFAESLVKLMSPDPRKDRDILKRGGRIIYNKYNKNHIFRHLFAAEAEDKITANIVNYFNAVKHQWPSDWDRIEQGNILNKTTGFLAFIGALPIIYDRLHQNSEKDVHKIADYLAFIQRIPIISGTFNVQEYLPGQKGINVLKKKIIQSVI